MHLDIDVFLADHPVGVPFGSNDGNGDSKDQPPK
jgi:hypothetical protein